MYQQQKCCRVVFALGVNKSSSCFFFTFYTNEFRMIYCTNDIAVEKMKKLEKHGGLKLMNYKAEDCR